MHLSLMAISSARVIPKCTEKYFVYLGDFYNHKDYIEFVIN